MANTDQDLNNYFRNREVDNDYYASYRISKHVSSVLPKEKEAKILDIGCGLGQFLNELKRLGYTDAFGVDVSDEAVDACRSKGLNVSKIGDISSFAQTHPAKYDFIIMNHVLEHLPKEIVIATLRNIRQHLIAPGGCIMIMVPNAQSATGAYWMYEDFTHYTLYTAGSISYVLKAAGYEEIRFVNADGTEFMSAPKRFIIKTLLKYYSLKQDFWNLVTQSSFHKPSPRIYSFELKVVAK